MKTLIEILAATIGQDWQKTAPGELWIQVESEGYMPLSIEMIGPGPRGLPSLSVCHYGEQNGDLMRDPEVCFEIQGDGQWMPYSFRNDYAGVNVAVIFRDDEDLVMVAPKAFVDLRGFVRMWDANLAAQGFTLAAGKITNKHAREAITNE